MKIKRGSLKRTKQLLQLHVIKSRIYNQKDNSLINLPTVDINKITIKLKKSIQIIFQFHKKNKRILFIGIPKSIEEKINIKTNHVALPQFFNISGLFINKSVLKSLRLKYQITNNNPRLTFSKLLYKPDLIVVFNSDNVYSIMKESHRSKIPVIHFNFQTKKKDRLYSYDVPGNYNCNNKSAYNLFFIMINAILNK